MDAALLEFSDVGFDLATAKSIADRAGVATGTFYQYFENKNDILCVLASERFSRLEKHVNLFQQELSELRGAEAGDTDRVEQLFYSVLKYIFDFHAADPELHQVLEQRRSSDPELKQIMHFGEQALKQKVLAFVHHFNVKDPEVITFNLFAMAEGIVHRLVFDQHNIEPDQALQLGASMLANYFREL